MKASDQNGFTLLEVLIAIVIAAFGLVSLSMMQLQAIKGNGVAGHYTEATFLAQAMIEKIKSGHAVAKDTFGFIDMSRVPEEFQLDAGVLQAIDERGDAGGPYHLEWQVFANTGWSRKISVEVRWLGISGVRRRVKISSVSRGRGN